MKDKHFHTEVCVLGHSFQNINHGKESDYYGVFEKNQPLRDFTAKYSIPDNRLVGIIYKGEQQINYIFGYNMSFHDIINKQRKGVYNEIYNYSY